MYGFALPYSRLRTTYESNNNDRYYTSAPRRHTDYHRSHHQLLDDGMASSKSNAAVSREPAAPARRNRYARSSTISVTQLLTDSCSSLLQRLTTRVRGPSSAVDTPTGNNSTTSGTGTHTSHGTATDASLTGSTRSRLEDKYSTVLEKLAGKRRDPERTLEPSASRSFGLTKSATTASVSDKSYSYASAVREKTPYRSGAHNHSQNYPEPPYAYLDRDSAYQVRHKSNHSDLRPRRSARPMRTGKSETGEQRRHTSNLLKLCPVEIPTSTLHEEPAASSARDDATPTNNADTVDPLIAEREAKRKEIQSLIMKYSALDEAYNRATSNTAVASKTVNSKAASSKVSQVPPVISPTLAIAQKYQQILPSASAVALTVSSYAVLPHGHGRYR